MKKLSFVLLMTFAFAAVNFAPLYAQSDSKTTLTDNSPGTLDVEGEAHVNSWPVAAPLRGGDNGSKPDKVVLLQARPMMAKPKDQKALSIPLVEKKDRQVTLKRGIMTEEEE